MRMNQIQKCYHTYGLSYGGHHTQNGGMKTSKPILFILLGTFAVILSVVAIFNFEAIYKIITTGSIFDKCASWNTVEKYGYTVDDVTYDEINDCYLLK